MPITHSSEPAKLREAAEALAKAFAGFFALAYVSGYLIVSAHLEALGIRSSGVSVVKAKYIWMGFLYLLPLLFLTAITALVWLTPPPSFRTLLWRFERTGRATTYKNRYPYVVSFMVMFLGSRMVFFTPRWREETACWLFAAMGLLLSFQIVHRIELHQTDELGSLRRATVPIFGTTTDAKKRHARQQHDRMVRCRDRSRDFKEIIVRLLIIPLGGTICYVVTQLFWPQIPHLPCAITTPPGSDVFTLFAFAAALICLHMQAATALHRDSLSGRVSMNEPSRYLSEMAGAEIESTPEDISKQRARWVVRTVMLIVLFFASIHGFAHLIYPSIPVERGGGRYSTGNVVDICVRPSENTIVSWMTSPNAVTVRPVDFCTTGVTIQDAVVLEQEPDTLYISSVHDSGIGKTMTAQCGLDNWHEGINGPAILALSVTDVIGVRDKDTVEHFCAALRGKRK
jgi:hypothetical protein